MTVFTPFAPTNVGPWSFKPTLDGQVYSATVTWGLFGQRWYFNLYTLQGALVLTKALVGSPATEDINLVEYYFQTSTLVFREGTQQFEVSP